MKICVCMHLYYMDMINEVKSYLLNLENYDLYITTSIDKKINEPYILENFPMAYIIYTDNVGFDVYPFTCFLREVNLDNYDLIFKLHTKKDIPIEYSINGYNLSGSRWRYYLLNSILGSKKRANKIIKKFKNNSRLGFIGSKELIIKGMDIDKDIDMNYVNKVMEELNLKVEKKEFLAGSMFVIRANILKPLKKRNYQKEDFPPYLPRTWNELPYCIERCFGMMVSAQGYELKGIYSYDTLKLSSQIKRFIRLRTPALYNILKNNI